MMRSGGDVARRLAGAARHADHAWSYAAAAVLRRPAAGCCLFTTGRAGSELLVDLLDSHPRVAFDSEILWSAPSLPATFIRGRARYAAARGAHAYGFKLAAAQLQFPRQLADPAGLLAGLAADGWLIVRLRRRDLLRQALSHARAEATRQHHVRDVNGAPAPMKVDPIEVVCKLRWIEFHEAWADLLLRGLPVTSLWYEDDLLDAESQRRTVEGLFSALGVDAAPVRSDLRKIAQRDLADDVANLDELIDVMSRTRFAGLLEGQASAS